jgi:transposase
MKPKTWTSEEDATLLRMRAEKMQYEDIARILGRTAKAAACRARILRNGAPGRKQVLTIAEVNEFARQAVDAGVSDRVIAETIQTKFGLTLHTDTVSAFRRKIKPPLRRVVSAPEPTPTKTEVQFAEWTIRKKPWPVKRLDQNGVPSGYVDISLAAGMVPA